MFDQLRQLQTSFLDSEEGLTGVLEKLRVLSQANFQHMRFVNEHILVVSLPTEMSQPSGNFACL
jgi:hypothetical protein